MTKFCLLLAPLLLIITITGRSTAFTQPRSLRRIPQHRSCPTLSRSLNPTKPIWPYSAGESPIRNKSTQLLSLFGLGPAEIAIIAIAAIFLIGPSKLTEFTRSAGEVAGKEAAAWKELKNIPEEFQKGLEEGEIESRSRKAKVMDKVEDEK